MEKPKKIIIVESCQTCPFDSGCDAWKKLDNKTKFRLVCGTNTPLEFILKDCPLDDFGH